MEHAIRVYNITLPMVVTVARTDEYMEERKVAGGYDVPAKLTVVNGEYRIETPIHHTDPMYASRFIFPGSGLNIAVTQRFINPAGGITSLMVAGNNHMSVNAINDIFHAEDVSAPEPEIRVTNEGKVTCSSRQNDAKFVIIFKRVDKVGNYCISGVDITFDAKSFNEYIEYVKLYLDNLASRDLRDTLRRAS